MRIPQRFRVIGTLALMILVVMLLHTIAGKSAGINASAEAYNECSDGRDNDLDGDIDYPQDDGCDTLRDDSEGAPRRGVFISVTDGRDEVRPGDSIVYRVEVRSDRTDERTVDVQLLLPHQANLVSASHSGIQQGKTVVWHNVSVQKGTDRVLTVNVEVNPNAEDNLLMVTEVTSDGQAAKDTTRVTRETRPVDQDVRLTITDGLTFARPLQLISYRIVVTNRENNSQVVDVNAQMPPEFLVQQVTGKHRRDGRRVMWESVALSPKESREFFINGQIERKVPDFFTLRASVSSGKAVAHDSTTISVDANVAQALVVSVNDGKQATRPNTVLNYEITLKNPTPELVTNLDVSANLPQHAEFIDAAEGGQWNGSTIHWNTLTVSPESKRVLRYSVRVRSDAPLGATLRSRVIANGNEAFDETDIADVVVENGRSGAVVAQNALLSKVADRNEVRPGDSVGYTVTLRNTTDAPFINVLVQDKFDGAMMRVTQADPNANVDASGIHWSVPVLAPGKTWSATYRVQVSNKATHGQELKNIVTVRGENMDTLSLSDKLLVTTIRVLTQLPPTGVAMDSLIFVLTSILTLAPVGMQLKRKTML